MEDRSSPPGYGRRSCGQKTGRVATPLAAGLVGGHGCPWRRRPAIAFPESKTFFPGTSIGSHGRTSSFNADPLSHSRNRKHPTLERRSVRRAARLRSALIRYRIPGIEKNACMARRPRGMITARSRGDGRRSGPPRTKCCNRAAGLANSHRQPLGPPPIEHGRSRSGDVGHNDHQIRRVSGRINARPQ
jgi:hypothetical protein